MASFNKIVIVGYLGKDPEIKYLTDGTAICSFSVATTERKKDKGGDYQDSTIWFKVNVWGKQGEACAQYLSKGSQAYVSGKLSQQAYADRDGNQRTSLEVRADDVQFLDRQPQGDKQDHRTSSIKGDPLGKAMRPATQQLDEDDIPF